MYVSACCQGTEENEEKTIVKHFHDFLLFLTHGKSIGTTNTNVAVVIVMIVVLVPLPIKPIDAETQIVSFCYCCCFLYNSARNIVNAFNSIDGHHCLFFLKSFVVVRLLLSLLQYFTIEHRD